jgi:predicted secreted protein
MKPTPDRRAARVLAIAIASLAAGGCATSTMTTPNSAATTAGAGAATADLRGFRIDARVGESFEVRLPGQRATGFRWTLVDPVPPVVRATGTTRDEAAVGAIVGASGQESFTFQAAEAGVGQLLFEFRRPADAPTVPPAQRASYRVEVR